MSGLDEARERRAKRMRTVRTTELVVRSGITVSGWVAIAILTAIAAFLTLNAWQALVSPQAGFVNMITGTEWYPSSNPPRFGYLPYIIATIRTTVVALMVSIPVGLAATVYISEFASRRIKNAARSMIEFLAAIPSVVYGLIGVYALGPWIKDIFHMPSALSVLTAGLVLSFMALPTIVAISEDAMHAVPKDLRYGSLALGNTRWQTAYKVTVPAAGSGIFAAVMLGMGRAIGETMVVLMLAGNSMEMTWSLFTSGRPLTALIAGEMGEVVQGGLHYSALFVVGLTLFVITFVINLGADVVLERQRRRWRR